MFTEHGRPTGSERRVRYRSSDNTYGDFTRDPMVLKNLKELLLIIVKRSPEYITNDVLKKVNESVDDESIDMNKSINHFTYL